MKHMIHSHEPTLPPCDIRVTWVFLQSLCRQLASQAKNCRFMEHFATVGDEPTILLTFSPAWSVTWCHYIGSKHTWTSIELTHKNSTRCMCIRLYALSALVFVIITHSWTQTLLAKYWQLFLERWWNDAIVTDAALEAMIHFQHWKSD